MAPSSGIPRAGAADELNYTQAAVSQHIAELERAVGLRLLERRPVRPTPAGELALAAAEAAGHALAAAETGSARMNPGEADVRRWRHEPPAGNRRCAGP